MMAPGRRYTALITRRARFTRRHRRILPGSPVLAAALILGTLAFGASGAAAQSTTTAAAPATPAAHEQTTATRTDVVTPTPDIIPRPGVGREPRDPGDRGGWWQEALFFLMCGAVLLIAGLIWRDSRRARRRQGRLPPRGAARAEQARKP